MRQPALHVGIELPHGLIVAVVSPEHLQRHWQGCRPGQVIAVVIPEGGGDVGDATVFALGFGNITRPFGIEVVVVEKEGLAETTARSVAEPGLALVTLRTIDGHTLVVGEDAPTGVLIYLI